MRPKSIPRFLIPENGYEIDLNNDREADIQFQNITEGGKTTFYVTVLPRNSMVSLQSTEQDHSPHNDIGLFWSESVAVPLGTAATPQASTFRLEAENDGWAFFESGFSSNPLFHISRNELMTKLNHAYQNFEFHDTLIAQGRIGDCYIIAPLNTRPIDLRKTVRANADGSYTVRVKPHAYAREVTVTEDEINYFDACLPIFYNLCYETKSTQSGFFGFIIHAAIAKDPQLFNLPENWIDGGDPAEVLATLTGMKYENAATSLLSEQQLDQILFYTSQYSMTASTSIEYAPTHVGDPPHAQHAYSLISYNPITQTIGLSEPHEPYVSQYVALADFKRVFARIQIPAILFHGTKGV